jgi:hypothetical protein
VFSHIGLVLALAVVTSLAQVALADELPSIQAVGADFVHRDGITGRGVTVAVIDDGLGLADVHIAPGGMTIIDGGGERGTFWFSCKVECPL